MSSGDSTRFKTGVSSRFIDSMGFLVEATWNEAVQRKQPIGTCRKPDCGGQIMPRKTYEEGKVVWFDADCNNCGVAIAAPGGRVLRRSSRRDEQPIGWWDQRDQQLKKLAALSKGQVPA